MKTLLALATLSLTLTFSTARAATPAGAPLKEAPLKAAPAQVEIRNAKVKTEIKDVAKWMAGIKNKPNVQASLYPSCPDGRNCYVISEKSGDFCCEQDAYGCKSWQTCSYYEGKCSGGATVMGDRYDCTVCSAASPDKPAEVQGK